MPLEFDFLCLGGGVAGEAIAAGLPQHGKTPEQAAKEGAANVQRTLR